jgi:hypothetical protein
MFLLPKGNPLYENIPVSKVNLPEMLDKLNFGGFTGYLRFSFAITQGVLFFESGKLISAMLERNDGTKLTAIDAMAEVSTLIFSGVGAVDVFRLSKDLTMCLHASLHGELLYKGQEIKLIDMKTLLEKMKSESLNGCLRIYTDEHTALIFYKDGAPLGFFHDGSQDIESTAGESQKIAGLPGAKLDVLSSKTADELMNFNLLEAVNINKLWEAAQAKHQSEQEKLKRASEERDQKAVIAKLVELEEDLKEMATAYLGKMGRTLIEKELALLGGRQCLISRDGVTKLFAGIEKGAKLLTSGTKIQEMLKALDAEINNRIGM